MAAKAKVAKEKVAKAGGRTNGAVETIGVATIGVSASTTTKQGSSHGYRRGRRNNIRSNGLRHHGSLHSLTQAKERGKLMHRKVKVVDNPKAHPQVWGGASTKMKVATAVSFPL